MAAGGIKGVPACSDPKVGVEYLSPSTMQARQQSCVPPCTALAVLWPCQLVCTQFQCSPARHACEAPGYCSPTAAGGTPPSPPPASRGAARTAPPPAAAPRPRPPACAPPPARPRTTLDHGSAAARILAGAADAERADELWAQADRQTLAERAIAAPRWIVSEIGFDPQLISDLGATWAQNRVFRQPKASERKCTSCRTLSLWRRYLHPHSCINVLFGSQHTICQAHTEAQTDISSCDAYRLACACGEHVLSGKRKE